MKMEGGQIRKFRGHPGSTDLAAKVVVLGVEQADERGVDGALVGHLLGAVHQDLEDLGLVGREVGLQNAGQALQVGLKGGSALKQ